ncbi:MAG: sodium:proton antiporter [Pirellulales bacterium]
MMSEHSSYGSGRSVCWAIFCIAALYVAALAVGLPQEGTARIVAAAHHDEPAGEAEHAETAPEATEAELAGPEPSEPETVEHHTPAAAPPVWTVLPFVLLLGAIALFPLIPATAHWWESNLHRVYVAAGLGLVTLLYFAFFHHAPIEGHWPAHHAVAPTSTGPQWQFVRTVFENAIFHEYVPFIVLLFSLYTISGGVRIEGDLRANPMTNATFIAVGGLLASFVGTTGAAMLLIRPLLETNRERKHVQHTVVFFIFIVCNCGGCLLPIGDPPLFLGYLRGVPFLWTLNLWEPWLWTNGLLLAIYCALDQFVFYPRERLADIQRDIQQVRRLKIQGLAMNGLLLIGVIFSVALLDPSKTFPGTSWHPWLYLREIVQLLLVGASLWLGSRAVRQANRFNYHAIVEVAALFCGIFICMQPALMILNVAGPRLKEMGMDNAMAFFWTTGGLSAILDNAPTYVVFFETARSSVPPGVDTVAGVAVTQLVAISLGAVFMGAMTYIGNGPNFMVRAIAETEGVRMPSFFGYILFYSVPILLPVLGFVTWRFLM